MYSFPNFNLSCHVLNSNPLKKVFFILILLQANYLAFSQNVGIGTSSPEQKLHVLGNIRIEDGRLDIDNGGFSTMIGHNAGINDSLAIHTSSTFIGYESGQANTSGGENTAVGAQSFHLNQTGNFDVAIGNGALDANLTGSYNSALGYNAMGANVNGQNNTAVGYFALSSSTGSNNSAFGTDAGTGNLTGFANTFLGHRSGFNNNGSNNVFIGRESGYNETGSNKLYISNSLTSSPLLYGEFDQKRLTINDTLISKSMRVNGGKISFINTGESVFLGEDAGKMDDLTANKNVFIGYHAGLRNTTGFYNIAIGNAAMDSSLTATYNTAIGNDALGSSSFSGLRNTAIGLEALKALTTGGFNVALGSGSMKAVTTASDNVALGTATLYDNSAGIGNVAIGKNTLTYQTSGNYNTSVGNESGFNKISGNNNSFFGSNAGANNLTGSNNVFLGYQAGFNETGSNKLYISNSNTSNPLIYGDFVQNRVSVGITTSAPKSSLDVSGSMGATLKSGLVAGTTHPDETGTVWHYSSGTGTITLPAASTCANRMYIILNQTGATRNISQYKDLAATNQTTVANATSLCLMSTGSEWFQIK